MEIYDAESRPIGHWNHEDDGSGHGIIGGDIIVSKKFTENINPWNSDKFVCAMCLEETRKERGARFNFCPECGAQL